MKILLTGGSGMLGQAILRLAPLIAPDLQIIAPTRTELNLLDRVMVRRYFLVNSFDAVIHAAAKVGGIKANMSDPIGFMTDNMLISLHTISLVLVLTYDTLGTYAASSALQKLDVFRLDTSYRWNDTFYSDVNMKVFQGPVGSLTSVVRPKDSVTVTNHVTRKSEKLLPQLRIRLNDDFGKSLIENFGAAKNDTVFGEFLKGFKITSSSPEGKSFLFGLDLSDAAILNASSNKLVMYYNVASGDSTLRKAYAYSIGPATINRLVQERTGSIVENFINNQSLGDSLSFVQSLGGTRTVVDLSSVRNLEGWKINKAELDVTVAVLNEPGSNYKLTPALAARYPDANGKLLFIRDISQALATTGNLYTVIGGQLKSSGGVNKYNLNITNHIKRIIADRSLNTQIQLTVRPEAETPYRMALCGARHKSNPLKLIITYTK